MEELRYPIGRFDWQSPGTAEARREAIAVIASTPANLRAAVAGLSEDQLDTTYRPGGWTVRQLVHHVADSHLNSYVRFRLALTEEEPTIKTYEEARWAELPDARSGPVEVSFTLLESLHLRCVSLLDSMSGVDFARRFHHPERGLMDLDLLTHLYAWHGRHHVAHVTALRRRMGW